MSPAPKSATSATFWRLWRWPIVLGLLSASGLLSALFSDGWGDWWSWLGLGLPVAVMVWFPLAARQPQR
jgi:hypothetical protein